MSDLEYLGLENGVIKGTGGHLFLADGGHHILEVVSGRRLISRNTIENFRVNITSRQEYVEQANVRYVHAIFPDKQSVLRQYFPLPDPICLGSLHLRESPMLQGVVFYPVDLLRDSEEKVFQSNDTHMTDYGSALVTTELVEVLTGEPQAAHFKKIAKQIIFKRQISGDLGSKLTPSPVVTELFLQPNWPIKWLHNDLVGGNNGIVEIRLAKNAVYPLRLLWFGDSFGRGCLQILSYFFREVIFLRTPFFHPDMFDQIKPDIVVTQNVERYLDTCKPDDQRPSFFMFPHLSGLKYEPGREFARAFSAMLSYPREPYQAYVAETGGYREAQGREGSE